MTQDMMHTESTAAPQDEAQPQVANYWGVDETHRFNLGDGHQYFDIKPMNEGAKTKFQKMTNKGIRMNQRSQEATIDVDPADERHTLIRESVVGWKLLVPAANGSGEMVPFDCPDKDQFAGRFRQALDQILEKFNPKAIQDLEFFIRTKNPWMQADMDIEEIDKEIDRLNELRKQAVEEKAGEAVSANK